MITLKYRRLLSKIMVVSMSVFLFTACEKEADEPQQTNKKSLAEERIQKFARLSFANLNVSNSTQFNSPNATAFTKVDASNNSFIKIKGNTGSFTDPASTGISFEVNASAGEGGGSANLDGMRYDFDFAFCASADFTGLLDGLNENEDDSDTTDSDSDLQIGGGSDVELDMFIGISGEFDLEGSNENMSGETFTLFALSYGGSSEIGNFDDFGADELSGAFIIAVETTSDGDAIFYFSTGGTVNFEGSEVEVRNVDMVKLDFGSGDDDDIFIGDEDDTDNNDLVEEEETVSLEANLQCVQFEE